MKISKYITDRTLNAALAVALLMLLVPAALLIAGKSFYIEGWMVIVYSVGAFLAVLTRIFQRAKYRKDKTISVRVRRLLHIEFWSSIGYLVSAYFLVSDPYHPGNWIAFLLAGAVLQIYAGQMIAWQQRKELKNKAGNADKNK